MNKKDEKCVPLRFGARNILKRLKKHIVTKCKTTYPRKTFHGIKKTVVYCCKL